MAKVVWTEQAYEDLEAIFEYISHDSVKYAHFWKAVIEGCLMAFPRREEYERLLYSLPET